MSAGTRLKVCWLHRDSAFLIRLDGIASMDGTDCYRPTVHIASASESLHRLRGTLAARAGRRDSKTAKSVRTAAMAWFCASLRKESWAAALFDYGKYEALRRACAKALRQGLRQRCCGSSSPTSVGGLRPLHLTARRIF